MKTFSYTYKLLFFIAVLCFAHCSLFPQSTNLNYAEELFIQTDRDIYFTGERVLLKIDVFNSLSKTPGNFSKVAYVDLFDDNGVSHAQVKVHIDNSSGGASMFIPDSVKTGNLYLRGYTQWMRNFPQHFYAYKQITVINPFEDIDAFRLKPEEIYPEEMLFFPESGSILAGVENKIGVVGKSKDGDYISFGGMLVNANGDTLSTLFSDRNGYAFLNCTPSTIDTLYLAVINVKGEMEKKFILPDVKGDGLSFSTKQLSDGIEVVVKRVGNVNSNVTVEYEYAYNTSVEVNVSVDDTRTVKFSNEAIPYGKALVSLKDVNENVLAKRWVYNRKESSSSINLFIDTKRISEREKVDLKISAIDGSGNPIDGNFSVSVVKSILDYDSPFKEASREYELMELGPVNSYMSSKDINDYLIFVGDNDAETSYSDVKRSFYYPELGDHIIRGVLLNKNTEEPIANQNVMLSFVSRNARCVFSKTDSNGRFSFAVSDKGLQEIVITPSSQNQLEYMVKLDDPFDSNFINIHGPTFYLDTLQINALNDAIIAMQIKNIYDESLQSDYSNMMRLEGNNFYGEPDLIIDLSDYIELTTVSEVIKELATNVIVQKRNKKSNIRILNSNPSGFFTSSPLVLLDGVPVSDIDELLEIPASELDKIDIFYTRYIVSDIIMEGIIHFVTKKGDLSTTEYNKDVFRQGYYSVDDINKYLSFPVYETEEEYNNHIPDYRNTLYWNPNVKVDANGTSSISFYTSDETGLYSVIVEGFSKKGEYLRETQTLSVIE